MQNGQSLSSFLSSFVIFLVDKTLIPILWAEFAILTRAIWIAIYRGGDTIGEGLGHRVHISHMAD